MSNYLCIRQLFSATPTLPMSRSFMIITSKTWRCMRIIVQGAGEDAYFSGLGLRPSRETTV